MAVAFSLGNERVFTTGAVGSGVHFTTTALNALTGEAATLQLSSTAVPTAADNRPLLTNLRTGEGIPNAINPNVGNNTTQLNWGIPDVGDGVYQLDLPDGFFISKIRSSPTSFSPRIIDTIYVDRSALGPTAKVNEQSLSLASGAASASITVTISDDVALDFLAMRGSATAAISNGAYSSALTLTSAVGVGYDSYRMTFTIAAAPGGSWDPTDTGIYAVNFTSQAFADKAGNLFAGWTDNSVAIDVSSGPGATTLTLVTAAASVAEGDAGARSVTYTIVRSGDATDAAAVDYSLSLGMGPGSAGTSDFVGPTSGTVVFAAGQTTKTITLSVLGETSVEADEVFTLQLSNPTGGALGVANAQGTIVNDDVATTTPVVPVIYVGTEGADTAIGTSANDRLAGLGGDDLLLGQEGADFIDAGDGNNTVVGGIDSLDGADLIASGTGQDLIWGNGGADTISSGAGADTVVGGYGTDLILGNQGDDLALANQGDDTVYSGQGDDTIYAGFGDDALWGGEGNDLLFGNEGADRYGFAAGSGADQINGFSLGEGDRLDLQGQTFTLSTSGDGDVLLLLTGGGTIELNAITPAQFSGGFLV